MQKFIVCASPLLLMLSFQVNAQYARARLEEMADPKGKVFEQLQAQLTVAPEDVGQTGAVFLSFRNARTKRIFGYWTGKEFSLNRSPMATGPLNEKMTTTVPMKGKFCDNTTDPARYEVWLGYGVAVSSPAMPEPDVGRQQVLDTIAKAEQIGQMAIAQNLRMALAESDSSRVKAEALRQQAIGDNGVSSAYNDMIQRQSFWRATTINCTGY